MDKAISDTSPPIHLNQIGYLHLLGIFNRMFITEQVKDELQGYNLFNTLKHDKAIKLQEENVNEQKLNKEELGKCVELLFNDSSLYLSSAFRMRVLRLIEEIEEEKR